MEGLTIVRTNTTRDACCNVLDTALDAGHTHGIGYWAELTKPITTERVQESVSSRTRTTAITIMDREMEGKPGAEKRINVASIGRAIDAMLRDPKGTESEGWAKALLSEDVPDGPLADAIIQVAFHGKVIYG